MKSTLPIYILLIASIIAFCSMSTVRSEPNPIQLPSEANKKDELVPDACGESSRSPKYCPVNCFRMDPVCGVDGVTYWCGCDDAMCSGTKVAQKGFCKVGDNGAAAQAFLLFHIIWLIVLGFAILLGYF